MHKARAFFHVCTGLFLLALGCGQSVALAQQVFYDDFTGPSLDTSKWTLEAGTGSLTIAGGEAILTCAGGEFPLLTTNGNPIPAVGDFKVTVGLRYPSITNLGVGIIALNVPGDPGFWVWQDNGRFKSLVASIGDSAFVPVSPTTNTDPHVFQWTCTGNTSSLTVDGLPHGSAAGTARPTGLGLGHPHPVSFDGGWTSLAVDFVSVELLQPTQVARATWGRIKALYR